MSPATTAQPTSTRAGGDATRGRGPMTELRRSRLRLEISREAVRLFRAQGVAGTSGEQIAEAVGLSARTLWRYFRSKESCVEPVLSLSVDTFVDMLRRWPQDLSLEEHLIADNGRERSESTGDDEAALAVIGMSRDEPALRAFWLVVYERAEPVLAEIVADRLGRSPEDVAIRVQAAALCAALRITTEDLAASLVSGADPFRCDTGARLSEALRAATHGVVGDSLPVSRDSVP